MDFDVTWWMESIVALAVVGVGFWANAWTGRRSAAGKPITTEIM